MSPIIDADATENSVTDTDNNTEKVSTNGQIVLLSTAIIANKNPDCKGDS